MLWMRVCERLFERQRCVGDGGRERERKLEEKRQRKRDGSCLCVRERERHRKRFLRGPKKCSVTHRTTATL